MASMKFHFAKILDVEANPVSCMSLNHGMRKLALFRGGDCGAIELWDVKHQLWLERVILDLEKVDGKPSVESIIWARNRLFSCGLHGFVLEHEVSTGALVHKSAATSGSVWCMGVNPSQTIIAVGTEDGFVNLFQIEERGLTYLRVLDRQEGRVLCLYWSPCGKYIATGSIDSVRLWDVNKGHAVQRLVTGRTKNRETIVWSILVLEGLTIVTGDSRGTVSFWDGKIGVLKFKMQTHKADVLTLRLSTDKNCIYAAGVDPMILNITRVAGTDKWMKSHPRNVHVNDVLTLETIDNRLFSGGVDTELGLSSFPPKVIVKYPNLPASSCISGSTMSKTLLVKSHKHISLWRLPDDKSPLTNILQLRSKGEQNIFSAAINARGNVIAYSVSNLVKTFLFDCSESISSGEIQPTLEKLNHEDQLELPSNDPLTHLKFVNDDTLLLLSSSGRVMFLGKINLNTKSVSFGEPIELEHEDIKLGVGIVTTAEDKICFTIDNRIKIYSIKKDLTVSKLCDLPTHSALPCTAVFHPSKPLLLVTYADHSITCFNFKTGRIVYQETLSKKVDDLQPFQGACWSKDGQCAVLYQNDSLVMLELGSEVEPKRKRRNSENQIDDIERSQVHIRVSPTKYKFINYVGPCNDGKEFVVVEIDANSILEKLPPAFARKRFGA